jgi:predicted MFS family arabinose efflux permease
LLATVPRHSAMPGYIQLLRRNPGYARLWLAQAVSLMGDWFSTIALSALVVRFSGGSGLAVSGLLLARFIPPLLVGPFAGVLVDRLNRKHLLIVSDVMRALIVLLFLFTTGPEHLPLIYLLTILQFSFSALFEPGQSALLPSLVPPEDLVMANTLGSVTWSAMLALGAAIGGVVSAGLGTPAALIIDAASFALSGLLIATITPRPGSHFVAIHDHTTQHLSQRGFRDGLRYISRHPVTATILLVKMGGQVGNIDVLMTIYATQLFVVGANGTGSLGVLFAAFGIGAIIGPIVMNRFNDGSVRTMRRLIVVAYGLIAVGWFLFATAPNLFMAAVALIIKAMGGSIYWTYSSVMLQKAAPDQYLGRLFSIDMAGFRLMVVISTLATGWALDRLSGTAGFQLSTAVRALLTSDGTPGRSVWCRSSRGTHYRIRQPDSATPVGADHSMGRTEGSPNSGSDYRADDANRRRLNLYFQHRIVYTTSLRSRNCVSCECRNVRTTIFC